MSREHFKFVLEKLDKRTILEQLAEEGSELSKASLKTIRAEEFNPKWERWAKRLGYKEE